MATCPNINLDSWKTLVASRGEDVAYYLWDKFDGNVPDSESRQSIVKSGIKATNALQSPKAAQVFSTLERNKVTGDAFWNKVQSDLQIPKEQIELLKQYNTTDREQLITNMLADYSFAIEINLGTERIGTQSSRPGDPNFQLGEYFYTSVVTWDDSRKYFKLTSPDDGYSKNNEISEEEYRKAQIDFGNLYEETVRTQPTQVYSNLTVPGGTNYTENEIATPAITPSIKGHAQFATDQGIGWFRSDEKARTALTILKDPNKLPERFNGVNGWIVTNENGKWFASLNDIRDEIDSSEALSMYHAAQDAAIIPTTENKTRRILELQSDLFQKGRDKDVLAGKRQFDHSQGRVVEGLQQGNKENQFLQLLNKGNNWVSFFIRSIIQDSAKKGYEKVLFPKGDTASKVEGHTTLEEFKKQKEDRIKELENNKKDLKPKILSSSHIKGVTLMRLNKSDGYLKDGYAVWTNTIKDLEDKSIVTKDTTQNKHGVDFTYVNLSKEFLENNFELTVKTQEDRIDNEINQLKQELKDVEEKGFGALKPIFNFYENTVTNTLKKIYGEKNVKEVTDEYGNKWNEISIVPEREAAAILFQLEAMPASRAAEATLNKVREAAKQMGIDIQELTQYVKSHPEMEERVKNANGVADLARGVVAIAEGRADTALTEEIVHVARAIAEQVNPKLITSLISKIDRFKIYKQTLEAYKGRKDYQLSDGKPNIRKIKMEAADKLIAELIINRNEGTTEYPELLQEENRSFLQRMWDAILDVIRGIYTKSNINLFETVAEMVESGRVGGTTEDLTADEIFLQVAENQGVNKFYDTIMDFAKRMNLVDSTTDKKRHYTIDGVEVPRTVTEKIKEAKSKKFERTEFEKRMDEMKREWGSRGHNYVEAYIKNVLIDKDGYRKAKPTPTQIQTELPEVVAEKIRNFATKLINSYKPAGTRFIIETRAVNARTKKLASTLDFIAIEPVGKDNFKVDILDWKFSSIDKTREEDVPWYKQEEWQEQMGEYANMMYSYGLKPNQLRNARMIPFIANYTNAIKDDVKSDLLLTSIEVGDLDNPKKTELYLLPVPINTESTGSVRVDNLLKSLRQQKDKIFKTAVSPEERRSKILQLNEIGKAIRSLQMKLDFSPLVNVGRTFLNRAADAFKSFENLDYSKLSEQEVRAKLGDLIEYKKSAEKYAEIGKDFLDVYKKETLDDEAKKTLDALEKIASSTDRMLEKIEDLQKEFVIQMAIKMKAITADEAGQVTAETKETYLAAEKEVKGLLNSFTEATRIPNRLINLASRAYLESKNTLNVKLARMIGEFEKALLPLQEEASRLGKSAFDMIGEVRNGQLRLIRKVSPKFYEDAAVARKAKNKKFFIDNMDMTKFSELAKQAIEQGEKELELMVSSTDADKDAIIKKYRIKKLRDSIDINRDSFNGFDSYDFNSIFSKTLLEEKHLSQEYENMSENAKKVWTFFNNLNVKAKDMGYIQKEGVSFFPLMEATFLQKLSQTSDLGGQTRDFFGDLFTARVNDLPAHAKIDPETNKIKREVPRYFTKTDKDVKELSKDLTKVGTLWIKSILEYENAKNLENVMLTVYNVEQSRGHIVVNENNEIIFEGGAPRVDERESETSKVMEKLIDDYIYGIKQDSSSFGNMTIDTIVDKVSGTDEETKEKKSISTKKGLENSNVLVRSLAVGLSPLISIANTFGFEFQAFITARNFYRYREFLGNHYGVIFGGLSTIDKGLMDLIVPLNDDVTMEKRRKMAAKNSYLEYLSTWTFSDVMMVTNSFPERKLQLTNAKTFNDNAMVVDGEIVNIRKYLKEQDRGKKYKISESERRELERSLESRVKELKETRSLAKIAEIKDGLVVIPGVSEEALGRYRMKIIEYTRDLNGQLSEDNKAGYRRDAMFSSFMMFKTWVPKQLSVRFSDLQKNTELEEWRYGRVRLFVKTWATLGFRGIFKMRDILQGTDEGIRIMNAMLEQKREDYYKKTGQKLEITEEEFYDLVREELAREMRELATLFATLGLLLAAKAAEPPEDADEIERNRYKFWAKAVNKISDEMKFYYNPLSFQSITKGSVLPQLGLLTKATSFIEDFSSEAYGYTIGDQELIEKNYPTKYFLNMVPGAYQFQRDILPLVNPELAKEMGIRVTTQSRLY